MTSISNRLFETMPPPGAPVTIAGIARAVGEENRKVVRAMDRLRTQGFVERLGTGRYQLTERGLEARAAGKRITSGPHGPHTGQRKPGKNTLYAKVWRVLRTRGKATIDDLMQLIGETSHKDPRGSIHRYLHRLIGAGYVTTLKTRHPGTDPTSNGFKVFMLLPDRNTGPAAPFYSTKLGKIIDPNDPTEGEDQ
ncbi:MAG: hypothetical protein HQL36_03610 [Alphaproteobacteria bacterium]|nr:hypothetical protein [Alphaproteobacteria bacterium]